MNCIATSSTPQLPWPQNCWRETHTSAGQSIQESTLRHTRKCWNSRRPPRGTMYSRQKDKLTAVLWKDTKVVSLLSSCHQGYRDKTSDFLQRNIKGQGERRATKKCVRAPPQAVAYTKHMGGVDHHDQHRSYQSCSRQSMKWWRKILYFLSGGGGGGGGANVMIQGSRWIRMLIFGNHYKSILRTTRK